MIDRYLERGTMYVLEDGGVKAECVVTDEGTAFGAEKHCRRPRVLGQRIWACAD